MKTLFCLALCALGLLYSSTTVAQNRQADSLALLAFYQSTNGSTWSTTWDLNQPMDTWRGITVDASGRVTSFFFAGCSDIVGTIPDFPLLSELRHLTISDGSLTGAIPNFSNLPKLERLVLSGHRLTGGIPDFSNLPNLNTLQLTRNELTGAIPDFSNLPLLLNIHVERNRLTSVPDFSNLPLLSVLAVDYNQISSIPDFSSLPQLLWISFSHTPTLTALPAFSNLPNLRTVKFNDCQISGPMPVFAQSTLLRQVQFHNNRFSGPLPAAYSNMTALYHLNISNNQFSGQLPGFAGAPILRGLLIDDNQFEDIDPALAQATGLNQFSLLNNRLTFEDLLPIHDSMVARSAAHQYGRYEYQSQQPIGTASTVAVSVGDDYTFDLQIDRGVSASVYNWSHGSQSVGQVTGDPTFSLINIQATDLGNYSCQVTHPDIPGLTLQSRSTTLQLGNSVRTLAAPAFGLVPNPAVDRVVLRDVPFSSDYQVRLISSTGQVLRSDRVRGTSLELSIADLPAGVYWVQLEQDGQRHQQRLVKY